MDTTVKNRVHEALEILEQVVKDGAVELVELIKEKYPNLKGKLVDSVDNLQDSIGSIKEKAKEKITHAKEVGEEKAKGVVLRVDENVHHHTWFYLSGVALSSLLLGYILGKNK